MAINIKKKIGIVVSAGQMSGGVFQYTESILDAMNRSNFYDIILFYYDEVGLFNKYKFSKRKLTTPSFNIFQIFVKLFQLLFSIRKPFFFSDEEKSLFKDIDLFLSPTTTLYPHYYLNKKFVFTLHDMQERYFPQFFTKYELFKRYIVRKKLAKHADKILCESYFVKNDIKKFLKVPESKVKIVESPPPARLLDNRVDKVYFNNIINKYDLPNKFIYYPAQLWYHKNHIKLLDAFAIVKEQFDDLHLLLTGNRDNNYHNIINKIKTLNLDNSVKYLGYVDYEDIPYLYTLSKFLIMPSLFESISLPIYEAFSLKIPVCCSNVVALPEQVGEAGLLFDPHDEVDIANKMIMYLKDDELKKLKGQLGYDRLLNYNHAKYEEKIINIFHSSINR